MGFEPTTVGLRNRCSTPELLRRAARWPILADHPSGGIHPYRGADQRTRTRRARGRLLARTRPAVPASATSAAAATRMRGVGVSSAGEGARPVERAGATPMVTGRSSSVASVEWLTSSAQSPWDGSSIVALQSPLPTRRAAPVIDSPVASVRERHLNRPVIDRRLAVLEQAHDEPVRGPDLPPVGGR